MVKWMVMAMATTPARIVGVGGKLRNCMGVIAVMLFFVWVEWAVAEPLRSFPGNTRYLEWRGKPVILIGSSEHYGAVINRAFDYQRYLDTVSGGGLNVVRIYTGTYFEVEGDFSMTRNTLAPLPGQLMVPWARSEVPGAMHGGNQFDLERWDGAYFDRLKDFVSYADKRGVVVEVTLFSAFLTMWQWVINPLNSSNNVQRVGNVSFDKVFHVGAGGDARLLQAQEAMVRKIVTELNSYDNVYYELCTDTRFVGGAVPWQKRMVEVIREAERALPKKHLIAQYAGNVSGRVQPVHEGISIYNFHYAAPPEAVVMNYESGKVISDDETGYRGNAESTYRTEAWDFVISGGGVFNHLDFSFTVGKEDGTFVMPETQPGVGSPGLRGQFKILAEFVQGIDWGKVKPDASVVKAGVPPAGTVRALVEPGRAVLIYLRDEGLIRPWSARWASDLVAPMTGEYVLRTISNDGVRVWVDDIPVIENWTDHPEAENMGKVRLEAGRRHRLKVEYFYNAGNGILTLGWVRPDGKDEIIPSDSYRLSENATGLLGEYFHGAEFNQRWGQRTDSAVEFLWGTKPPFTQPDRSTGMELAVELGEGMWRAQWMDPASGRTIGLQTVRGGGVRMLSTPAFETDTALKILRIEP